MHRDYDGKVTPEEVASAAMYLKDTLGKEGLQELISNLSKDRGIFYLLKRMDYYSNNIFFIIVFNPLVICASDGKISVEDIIKLGSQKDESEEGRK